MRIRYRCRACGREMDVKGKDEKEALHHAFFQHYSAQLRSDESCSSRDFRVLEKKDA